jgi:hypothetical protein
VTQDHASLAMGLEQQILMKGYLQIIYSRDTFYPFFSFIPHILVGIISILILQLLCSFLYTPFGIWYKFSHQFFLF